MDVSDITFLAVVLFLCVSGSSITAGEDGKELRAFPDAEGFGAHARGGRGGAVLFVTNTKDYKPGSKPIKGSLRWAIEQDGPRTIVFRTSGTIALKDTLSIREPFVTIAGQTAPGKGICVKRYGVFVSTHDVVVRFMRFRPGAEVGYEKGGDWQSDAISVTSPGRDVIIDHCSASWANDEVLSVSGKGIDNVTVQWCMITESLNDSTHPKGEHGYGSLIRTNGDVTFHHNLYAYHTSRSPRPGTYGEGSILLDFRNNFMYRGGKGYSSTDPVRMNFVGNFHRDTPFNAHNRDTVYFARHNVGRITGGKQRDRPFETAPVNTTSAKKARQAVMQSAGAVLPERDGVDQRVLGLILQGKGEVIDRASDVGGWPELESAKPPQDRDRDGLPDRWEAKYARIPTAYEPGGDADEDGYTNLEEFLNGTSPKSADNHLVTVPGTTRAAEK